MNLLIEQITGVNISNGWVGTTVYAFSILIMGLLAVTLVRILVSRGVKRESPVYSAFRHVALPLLYAASVYIAFRSLPLSSLGDRILGGLAAAVVTVLVIRASVFGITGSVKKYVEKTGREQDEKRIRPFLALVNFVLWIIGAMFMLDNLGFDISAVVTGLGVSGIAVAIAAQGILGDLFNYFVIFFDHPFEIGDFIIFNDKLGSVEKIGIKTTRIRALSGEQMVVSNSDLTGSIVHNYKRMQERRVVFTIGVTYQTPSEQLDSIPRLIREIIEANEEARFDRSHFRNYGDFALIFETVYYVLSPDYAKYMDIQQEINLAIYRSFEQRGIEFAYPTSKVILSRED
ncbi:MAG: mechanosensitive ion channel family protein [Spirochaetia bacterium]